MSDLHSYDNHVWDRLFDSLYSSDGGISDAEIDSELREAHIDIGPAVHRLRAIIEERRARQKLAEAREHRSSLMERLRPVIGPTVKDLRAGVREFIDRVFSGPEQVAHYHKLERAATDEDLSSLLDDLTRLAELRRTEGEDELEGE